MEAGTVAPVTCRISTMHRGKYLNRVISCCAFGAPCVRVYVCPRVLLYRDLLYVPFPSRAVRASRWCGMWLGGRDRRVLSLSRSGLPAIMTRADSSTSYMRGGGRHCRPTQEHCSPCQGCLSGSPGSCLVLWLLRAWLYSPCPTGLGRAGFCPGGAWEGRPCEEECGRELRGAGELLID